MAGEIARPVEEYVEGDPEGARILRADFVTDVAELNHGPPPCALRWAGAPDRYIRSGPARTGRRARRYDSAGIRKTRSEEHTSELQSLMRISYAVFCLTKKKT